MLVSLVIPRYLKAESVKRKWIVILGLLVTNYITNYTRDILSSDFISIYFKMSTDREEESSSKRLKLGIIIDMYFLIIIV